MAESAPWGAKILAILPDTGEPYLSTPMFEDVSEAMSEEEMQIAASTPRFRFDVSAAATPAAVALDEQLNPDAVTFVEETLGNPEASVVKFALEWCEFCWSVPKLFAEAGIPFKSVDLDSVAYQENNRGGDIRTVLRQKLGTPTIPQIFVGGTHIGGATEAFDAFNDGSLQKLLKENSVEFNADMTADAYSYLPKWLHPR